MSEEFDVVILGTSLKHCVLAGILSALNDKKVLLIDRHGYYGGAGPTLQLQQLFKHFGKLDSDISQYGNPCSWNVDIAPKLLMANGTLVSLLVKTGVIKSLKFKTISSKFECRSGRLRRSSDIEVDVQDLLGNSLLTDDVISSESEEEVDGDEKRRNDRRYSFTYMYPYIYPLYGQEGILRGFSSLCSDKGGRVMLEQSCEDVKLEENGEVTGVYCGDRFIRCKHVITDPAYFPEKVRKVGQVVRAVCLLQAGIPNIDNAKSCQIRIPRREYGRKSDADIRIVLLSSDHMVCADGWHVATLSTTVETDNPEQELEPGFQLLGSISEKFVSVSDVYEPIEDNGKGNIFICKSEDASHHCETIAHDIIEIYERITGKVWKDIIAEDCSLELSEMRQETDNGSDEINLLTDEGNDY